MTALIVDASVWVSAADSTDSLCEESRAFLIAMTDRGVSVALHEFAVVEIACALARRLRDASRGRVLTEQMLRSPLIEVHPLIPSLISAAIELGTRKLLRAGDSLYAALSHQLGGEVVSWDDELIRRAEALDPVQWLERDAREGAQRSRPPTE
jgi:predicted nucleic acid-binding protein